MVKRSSRVCHRPPPNRLSDSSPSSSFAMRRQADGFGFGFFGFGGRFGVLSPMWHLLGDSLRVHQTSPDRHSQLMAPVSSNGGDVGVRRTRM